MVVKVIVDKKWYNTYIGKFFFCIYIKDKKMLRRKNLINKKVNLL